MTEDNQQQHEIERQAALDDMKKELQDLLFSDEQAVTSSLSSAIAKLKNVEENNVSSVQLVAL
ncbi:hypothetical protein [Pseudomonas amygdali]|uniref:hypothetical protein n=1 Tax=Pseudomonas amygdali TaxID=47877 RepID=UPI000CD2C67E|nr:hypothetical protein [Pseudomonas amygdali]POC98433.1 hypothetical protein BKM22_26305 [Pseudomonas amygdali pv. morsprunorum]POD38145.1 hypothetical protein BKM16_26220 [Pseudomonas amygdali pv. morsprunorum]POD39937.1 hypothetical protein BKM02_26360 [Pseudomonas amygdali pv. morsprunorum]POY79850.1 hypothetical protein BKM09_014460 [Pseudomonas amygdali pv. morsprunorum]